MSALQVNRLQLTDPAVALQCAVVQANPKVTCFHRAVRFFLVGTILQCKGLAVLSQLETNPPVEVGPVFLNARAQKSVGVGRLPLGIRVVHTIEAVINRTVFIGGRHALPRRGCGRNKVPYLQAVRIVEQSALLTKNARSHGVKRRDDDRID